MISSQTEVAVATGDFILLGDTSDSNNLKKAPISSILAGTLTTAAQTNITSLGTLTALTGGTGDLVWDSTTFVVDSSANKVGIGTASPDNPLDIEHVGGDGAAGVRIISTASDGFNWITEGTNANLTAGEYLAHIFGKEQASKNSAHIAFKYASDHGDDNALQLGFYGVNDILNVTAGAKVGIGNPSPGAKLDVVATSGEVLRADSNGGAYRLVATQTGVNMQGVVDILGTTLIHNVQNYTGLEIKGNGASRPAIQLSNANQGDLAMLYGTEGNALVIATNTNNTPAINIDSSQRINMPGQPCFSVALPAETTSGNVIIFGGEHKDVGNHYNTSNGRFTAPIAGNYFFSFWILMDPSGAGHYSRVLFGKNGGYSTQWTDNLESTDAGATAAYHSVGGSAIIPMAANDYVDLKNDGQSPTYGTQYGNWSGFLVS
jgi:hypothetical protein